MGKLSSQSQRMGQYKAQETLIPSSPIAAKNGETSSKA
jgi:hypothetical protein